ncbi:hypothetical protein SynRS9915_00041 [Synechococcus sp. RS9915]|nr:hypothetical protein SynRS9915_00041 [Synechococcus sp. RS9915]
MGDLWPKSGGSLKALDFHLSQTKVMVCGGFDFRFRIALLRA